MFEVDSDYYTEESFNEKFSNNQRFSLIHLNIRSIPSHFTEFLCYRDVLEIEFKIIALSETALNVTHTHYKIPNYNCEMDYRPKRKEGGVSLYIHSLLQYKPRKIFSWVVMLILFLLKFANLQLTQNTKLYVGVYIDHLECHF